MFVLAVHPRSCAPACAGKVSRLLFPNFLTLSSPPPTPSNEAYYVCKEWIICGNPNQRPATCTGCTSWSGIVLQNRIQNTACKIAYQPGRWLNCQYNMYNVVVSTSNIRAHRSYRYLNKNTYQQHNFKT